VRDLVSWAGQVGDHLDYSGYGAVTETNPAAGSRYGYDGYQYQATLGLDCTWARWYNPSTGTWQTQDPLGFAAGQSNLYTYSGNDPANFTDPSGLEKTTIGGKYEAKIEWVGKWDSEDKKTVRAAALRAAKRIEHALAMMNDWESVTKKHRFIKLGNKMIESPRWKEINANKRWLKAKLRSVYRQLTSEDTVIPFENRKDLTHPERNSMYTRSIWVIFTEVNRVIVTRSHYWGLPSSDQAFWTGHEFARFFELMEDDRDPITVVRAEHPINPGAFAGGGNMPSSSPPLKGSKVVINRPGVQSWDSFIDWLNDRD
jgi:RHS repeat-associated protein